MMPALHRQERIFINKFTYPVWLRQHRARRYGSFLVPPDPAKSYISG